MKNLYTKIYKNKDETFNIFFPKNNISNTTFQNYLIFKNYSILHIRNLMSKLARQKNNF